MKLKISRHAALPLGFVALTTRLFVAIAIDQPELMIAGWMSALLGGLLCVPMLLAVNGLSRRFPGKSPLAGPQIAEHSILARTVELLFASVLLLEAVDTIRLIAILADYTTMTSLQMPFLIVPLVAALFFALLSNGEGIGGAARLWLRVLPCLLLIVFLQHLKTYNPRWLLPIFGSGPRTIAAGAVSTARAIAPAALLWLSAEPDTSERGFSAYSLAAVPTVASALLLLLHAAMTPAQIFGSGSRLFQLDSIISNGRAALGTQLPMTLVWFACLLLTLAFELYLSAHYLQRAFERFDGKLCVAAVCATAALLSLSGRLEQKRLASLEKMEFPLFAGLFLLLLILSIPKRKKVDRP